MDKLFLGRDVGEWIFFLMVAGLLVGAMVLSTIGNNNKTADEEKVEKKRTRYRIQCSNNRNEVIDTRTGKSVYQGAINDCKKYIKLKHDKLISN